jgi:hypothetical protein
VRGRRAGGFLLILAGVLFLVSGFLTSPRRLLSFVAGGLLIAAGISWLIRAREGHS